ncbi:GTP-binding protein YchF [Anopheles sinensis]|uniref:GTP-binding protein YchF n=1 Tax=Anopheles sinensis TaxID=74873 RepID=A0A084WEX7_ANOSI|nr:GTP-binding protein YchF [Anopheles sinensis]
MAESHCGPILAHRVSGACTGKAFAGGRKERNRRIKDVPLFRLEVIFYDYYPKRMLPACFDSRRVVGE